MNSWLKTALCLYNAVSDFRLGGLLRSKRAERSAIPERPARAKHSRQSWQTVRKIGGIALITAEQFAKLAEQSAN